MIKPCYPWLAFQVHQALSTDWHWPEPLVNLSIWNNRIELNPEWQQLVQDQLGLQLDHTVLFWRGAAQYDQWVHYDLNAYAQSEHRLCINWCIGGRNSRMLWYDHPMPTWREPRPRTEPIHSEHIGQQPYLVRTDQAHCVDNPEQSRWAISIRFQTKMTWQQQVLWAKQRGFIDAND